MPFGIEWKSENSSGQWKLCHFWHCCISHVDSVRTIVSLHQPHSVELRWQRQMASAFFFLSFYPSIFILVNAPVFDALFASRFYVSHTAHSLFVFVHIFFFVFLFPFHPIVLMLIPIHFRQISFHCSLKFNWISTQIKKLNVVNFVNWNLNAILLQCDLTGRLIAQIKFDNLLEQLIK